MIRKLTLPFQTIFSFIMTNDTKHFIKIPFTNKGIEFIDLPSIFKDISVTS